MTRLNQIKLSIFKFLRNYILLWVDFICNIVGIITFTMYKPIWNFTMICSFDKFILRKYSEYTSKTDREGPEKH